MSQLEQAQEFFTKMSEASQKAIELQTAFGEQYTADVTQYFTDLGEVIKSQFESAPQTADISAAIEAANAYNESVKSLTEGLVSERTDAFNALSEELKGTFEFLAPAAAKPAKPSTKKASAKKAA